MAETDPQKWVSSGFEEPPTEAKVSHHIGASRTGRQHDSVVIQGFDLGPWRVIGHHHGCFTQEHSEHLVEVVGERVVIIDQEKVYGHDVGHDLSGMM
jgi:hypothetical protein